MTDEMKYFIEVMEAGRKKGIVTEDMVPKPFESKEAARMWADENVTGKLVIGWEVITEKQAKKDYRF